MASALPASQLISGTCGFPAMLQYQVCSDAASWVLGSVWPWPCPYPWSPISWAPSFCAWQCHCLRLLLLLLLQRASSAPSPLICLLLCVPFCCLLCVARGSAGSAECTNELVQLGLCGCWVYRCFVWCGEMDKVESRIQLLVTRRRFAMSCQVTRSDPCPRMQLPATRRGFAMPCRDLTR
jgi:hypothetical protein